MKIIYTLLLIQLLFSFEAKSQNIELQAAALEIMTSSETCALITLDEAGMPRARAMETLPPEDDFIIWFGTNPKSRKVAQIKNDPRVTLYYLDKDESGYVVLYGTAKIINSKKEKDAHWKTEWEAFYPNKEEDYVLIKVTPNWMEIISNSRGIFGDSITWEVPKVQFSFTD